MRSGRGCTDMDEAIEWVVEESKRRGKPIPINVVIEVLCLYVEFQLLVGNVAVVAESSDDPLFVAVPHEGDRLSENFICPQCRLGSRTKPPDGDGSKGPPSNI